MSLCSKRFIHCLMNYLDLAVHCGPEVPSNDQHLYGHDSQVMDDRKGCTLEKHASANDSGSICKNNEQHCMDNMNTFHVAVAGYVAGHLHSDKPGCDVPETMEMAEKLHSYKTGCGIQETADICHIKSENNDLFKKHFSSLSSITKVSTLFILLFLGVMFVNCEFRLDFVYSPLTWSDVYQL